MGVWAVVGGVVDFWRCIGAGGGGGSAGLVGAGVCIRVWCGGGGGGSAGNKVLTTLREMRPLWKFHSSGISQPCGDVCGEISVSPSPEPGSPFVLFSFFHFIRLFWNQILICRSVRQSACAISMRRRLVRYRLKWNSFSSSRVWYRVYVCRPRFLSETWKSPHRFLVSLAFLVLFPLATNEYTRVRDLARIEATLRRASRTRRSDLDQLVSLIVQSNTPNREPLFPLPFLLISFPSSPLSELPRNLDDISRRRGERSSARGLPSKSTLISKLYAATERVLISMSFLETRFRARRPVPRCLPSIRVSLSAEFVQTIPVISTKIS